MSGLQESYNELPVKPGKRSKDSGPGNEYNAHAYGINETGELIVRTQKKRRKTYISGESICKRDLWVRIILRHKLV